MGRRDICQVPAIRNSRQEIRGSQPTRVLAAACTRSTNCDDVKTRTETLGQLILTLKEDMC